MYYAVIRFFDDHEQQVIAYTKNPDLYKKICNKDIEQLPPSVKEIVKYKMLTVKLDLEQIKESGLQIQS